MEKRDDTVPTIHLSWLQAALIAGGVVAFFAIDLAAYVWLADATGWPRSYGIECRRRCIGAYLWNSPRLLQHGGTNELILFALLWAWPAGLAASTLSVRKMLRKRRKAEPAAPIR